jgi:CubicO group peptidase (beta-lactamase class C family)
MERRAFLQSAVAGSFLTPAWRTDPPGSYVAEIKHLMRAAPVPGAVIGSVRRGKPSWMTPLGVRAEGSTEAVTTSTLFHAASLTKQTISHAAFVLRDSGKLDFDRPLVSYLDDLPDPTARTVTTRHVLSHSLGFPNWRSPDASKAIPNLVPAFTPGSRFQYSGEGFFYLQRVLEEVCGTGIGRVLSDLVFQPLEMTSSTLIWDPETSGRTALPHDGHGKPQDNWDKPDRALRAYAARIGEPVAALRYEDYAAIAREAGDPVLPGWMNPNAAGRLITTAQDYSRFLAGALRYSAEIGRQQVSINEFLGWGLGSGNRTFRRKDLHLAMGRQRYC